MYDQLPSYGTYFQFNRKLYTHHSCTLLTEALKELLQIILPIILLVECFDNLVLKYVAAVNVVVWSFDTMLIISKWPGKFKQINIVFLNDIIHKMHLIFYL